MMVEHHFDSGRDLRTRKIVDGIEDPKSFGQNQVGYPGPFANKLFCCVGLIVIVSCDESIQGVRVNREHAVVEYAFGWPLHVRDGLGVRRAFRKERPLHVGRTETARPPYDHTAILLVPLEHGARTYTEFLPHFDRD